MTIPERLRIKRPLEWIWTPARRLVARCPRTPSMSSHRDQPQYGSLPAVWAANDSLPVSPGSTSTRVVSLSLPLTFSFRRLRLPTSAPSVRVHVGAYGACSSWR
jgi:hypothetical protein